MENRKLRQIVLGATIVLMCFAGGCAKSMALKPKMKSLDLSKESIALMTIRVSNQVNEDHQPTIFSLKTLDPATHKDVKTFSTKLYKKVSKEYTDTLVSLSLPPGKHGLGNICGYSDSFLICGRCDIPLNVNFELGSNEIAYIGRIDVNIVPKKSDDQKSAGPIIPLIDQAVTGFHKGTGEITIINDYMTDIATFQKTYPILQDKVIMNRCKSQQIFSLLKP